MSTKTFVTSIALAFVAVTAGAQTAAPAPAGSAATPRIDQGVASGQLTRRETHRLERQQGAIDRAEDRAKADGKVTHQERARLQQRQDNASANIARQKHDAQKRPRAASAPTAGAPAVGK